MPFSKTFPKKDPNSSYPIWEEIYLTKEDEQQAEDLCSKENFRLLDQALNEAKIIAIKHGLNTDENRIKLAVALFEKKASHSIFWKENKAKEKFDQIFKH
ncbi:MAG TPA: hypothetical protein VJI98_01785 [Candidatus Nanoarchaeia archaeon]|nr:hypothetical protein [Candidatus Nanoarchaeia archaeon]